MKYRYFKINKRLLWMVITGFDIIVEKDLPTSWGSMLLMDKDVSGVSSKKMNLTGIGTSMVLGKTTPSANRTSTQRGSFMY